MMIVDTSANDALDFWRQEWTRQNAQAEVTPTQSPRSPGRLQLTVRPHPRESSRHDKGSGHQSDRRYCVRSCDGYYFPLTRLREAVQDKELCAALCPSAKTEVFRLKANDDSIERAVSSKGTPYDKLGAAFAYRTGLKKDCTCGSSRNVEQALLTDPTLAAGDIVVTARGVRVFAGGASFPFKERDFIALRKARGLPRALMTYLSLIDQPFRETELKESLNNQAKGTATVALFNNALATHR